jgi:hypothetical protein
MDAPLYAGALNGFDLRGFLELLRTIAWSHPQDVQVMVRAPDEDRWQLLAA